jgi:hypothetical protein
MRGLTLRGIFIIGTESVKRVQHSALVLYGGRNSTLRSESRCTLRLLYVDLVVSNEVAVEVCCCFTVFSCYPLKDGAQTASFKDPVRTAL